MLLFAVCVDHFLRALASTLPGIHVGSSGTHSAELVYADDVTIILQSPKDIPQIQTVLDLYGALSGAKINIKKSKAMGVGRLNTTVIVMGIQCHESMKILGNHFTTTVRQSTLRRWSVVRDEIRAQARET